MSDLIKRVIQADINHAKGPRRQADRFCIGSGRAHEGLMAEHQRHLALAHDECGFRYIRFHGLLHDDMGVYRLDSTGKPFYDWQYIDLLFDYILDIGMVPFVELGFMPSDLASGPETIFWWKGNVTLPRSQAEWVSLVVALVRHWTDRYGVETIRSWYFEVWNEPNLSGFFAGTQEQYFDLYDITARAVKSVDAAYKVGGPATAGCGWISEFIDFCVARQAPVDFVSTHTYGIDLFLDEFGTQQVTLDANPDSVVKDARAVAEQVRASALPNLEIHFTEWSASCTPRDPIHDSYCSPAWILSKLKRCEGLVDSMSYWTFSDIFEEPGPPTGHFHGGFGLLNTQGVRKPAFFAYSYLNRLGPEELACDDADSWVCRSERGTQALLWNVTGSGVRESNQSYYPKNLPPQVAEDVTLALSGYARGRYRVVERRVGYGKNDAYTAFLAMSVNGTLSRDQVKALHDATADAPYREATIDVGPDGVVSWKLALDANEVAFVEILGA